MTHRYIKIGMTALVLVLAFTALMWSTLREGTEYFKHVDEVVSNPQAWEGKRLQLHGYVVPGSLFVKPNTLEYKFKVQNNPARTGPTGGVVDATYKGIVPDTFKDEAEVVLKGQLTATGFRTEANGVMAKCPSKYVAKTAPLAGS
ncbi:MAG TPA: cytochrome c maturation protein CcmE [Vicinamibacterales bacterium]|jgi:cytochrome c-type biogenesis protein CcmE